MAGGQAPNADLTEILIFTHVVRGGSFTSAASALDMPKSTVSRKIAELEARVGARLLQRTTRTVRLTDVGRVYYEHCVRIVAELEEAAQAVAQMQAAPRGLLRISVPPTFTVLAPIVAEYLRLYPDVHVELVCTDRRVDLVEERFDLALRAGSSPDSTLVARKLGVVRRRVLASPALIEQIGDLTHPSELGGADCVVFTPEGATWELCAGARHVEVTVRSRLSVNDYDMLHAVARTGLGLALLPEYQCLEDVASGRLARVLERWSAREVPVLALYPSTRHLSPKLTAMLDLLRERLALTLGR